MKKYMFISMVCLLIFAVGSTAVAQLPENPVSFGIKAGLNISTINADNIDADSKMGFIGGAFAGLSLGNIEIQPELLYSMKGYKVDTLDIDQTSPVSRSCFQCSGQR